MEPAAYNDLVQSRRAAALQQMRQRRQHINENLQESQKRHEKAMKTFHENRRQEEKMSQILDMREKRALDSTRARMKDTVMAEIEDFEQSLIQKGLITPKKSATCETAPVDEDKALQDKALQYEVSLDEDVINNEQPSFEQYVKRMRDRRMEDVASRTRKAERRARKVFQEAVVYRSCDKVNAHLVQLAKQEQPCSLEGQLLAALAQQSRWYMVISSNSRFQEGQRTDFEKELQGSKQSQLEKLAKTNMDEYLHVERQERQKWEELGLQQRNASAQENYNTCSNIIRGILSLCFVEVDYSTQDFTCEKTLPNDKRIEARRKFVKNASEVTLSDLGGPLSMPEEVADYVGMTGKWSPTSDSAIAPRYPSGASVAHILDVINHIANPTPPAVPVELSSNLIYIVTTGKKYAGKSVSCKAIAAELHLFHANDISLVDEALNSEWELILESITSDAKRSLIIEQLKLGTQLKEVLMRGEAVSEEAQINLLILKMRWVEACAGEEGAYKGIISDGVPCTAQGFSYLKANIRHKDLPFVRPSAQAKAAPFFANLCPCPNSEPNADDFVDEPPPPVDETKDTKKPPPPPPKKTRGKDEPDDPVPPVELPAVSEIPTFTDDQQQILHRGTSSGQYDLGVHLVLNFECDSEKIFTRMAGLRLDVDTNEMYHLTYFPPPLDRQPYLIEVDRSDANNAQLHAKLRSSEAEQNALAVWFAQNSKDLLIHIDGTQDVHVVTNSAVTYSKQALEKVTADFKATYEAKTILAAHRDAVQANKDSAIAREEVRKKLKEIYKERGLDIPPELHDPPAVLRTLGQVETALSLEKATTMLSTYQTEITKFLESVERGVVLLSGLEHRLSSQWVNLLHSFAMTLGRERPPTTALTSFAEEFNQFDAELRSDEQAKDELHLRTDGLFDALRKEVDSRREEAINLVEGYSKAMFNETWLESTRAAIIGLMQSELLRFMATVRLIVSYYSEIMGREIRMDPFPVTATINNAPKGLNEFFLVDHIHFNDPAAAAVPEPPTKDTKGGKKVDPKPAGKAAAPVKRTSLTGEGGDEKLDSIELAAQAALAYVAKIAALEDANTSVPEPAAKTGAKVVAQQDSDNKKNPVIDAVVKRAIAQEIELLKERLSLVKAKGQAIVQWGQSVAMDATGMMRKISQAQYSREISLMHDAVSFVRKAIEEEHPLHYAITVADSSAREDLAQPLVPLRAQPVPRTAEIKDLGDLLLPWMTKEQFQIIIHSWKAQSTNGMISSPEFLSTLNAAHAVGSGQVLEFWSRFTFDMRQNLYNAFANAHGLVDWKRLALHLLLWSEPEVRHDTLFEAINTNDPFASRVNPNYVPTPQLSELVNLRQEIMQLVFQGKESGSPKECQYISLETFNTLTLWLERRLSEVPSKHIRKLLWEMFSIPCPKGVVLSPQVYTEGREVIFWPMLLLYFCLDEQHIRGIQKAFSVLSAGSSILSRSDGNSLLSASDVHLIYHFSAPPSENESPEALLDDDMDPYNMRHIQIMFREIAAARQIPEINAVSFADTLGVHRGRVLWNKATLYSRRNLDVAGLAAVSTEHQASAVEGSSKVA